MARVTEKEDRQPNKPRVYEVVVQTFTYNKSGRKMNYNHTIKYDGWDEFFADWEN